VKIDTSICPFQIYSEKHCKVALYMHMMSESHCLAVVDGGNSRGGTKQASDSTPSHVLRSFIRSR